MTDTTDATAEYADADPTETGRTDPTESTDGRPETDRPTVRDRTTDRGRTTAGFDDSRLRELLDKALLGALVLLALVSTVQFYSHATAAIGVWVTPEYEPLFQAAFNLVVLAVALVGVGRQLRRVDAA